jgi:hypothetical protein
MAFDLPPTGSNFSQNPPKPGGLTLGLEAHAKLSLLARDEMAAASSEELSLTEVPVVRRSAARISADWMEGTYLTYKDARAARPLVPPPGWRKSEWDEENSLYGAYHSESDSDNDDYDHYPYNLEALQTYIGGEVQFLEQHCPSSSKSGVFLAMKQYFAVEAAFRDDNHRLRHFEELIRKLTALKSMFNSSKTNKNLDIIIDAIKSIR